MREASRESGSVEVLLLNSNIDKALWYLPHQIYNHDLGKTFHKLRSMSHKSEFKTCWLQDS